MIPRETISELQSSFHANTGTMLSEIEALKIAKGMLSLRDSQRAVRKNPKHLFQAAFQDASFYGKSVHPCDILSLRLILERQRIESSVGIALWSLTAAKKVFRDYQCFLLLKIDPSTQKSFLTAGGMAFLDEPSLDIQGRVSGLIVMGRAPFEVIEKIVAETAPGCPIYGEAYVPGLDRKKVASAEKTEKQYVINLPAVGIENVEVKACDDKAAVAFALARRWDRLLDSKTKPKPPRFTVQYWLVSGFWDSIVKEAEMENLVVKTAQTSEGPQIQLSPEEEQVFQTILAIDQQFGLGQQYRVAGGWVRDRLLGTKSDDIDIALDKMTGQQFLRFAEQYAQMNPNAQIGKNYVVSANDAKSKHLETTALEIGPFKIDFVNLRSEDYASDSRVPEMKFGTPETDAQRRDLTINALFYNIGSKQVEDYVGGLQDLQSMVLRTPLDPVQTFMDDPLRMLRVLRFNSRYENAQLAPEVVQAMSQPEVHQAYATKVAPERAGPEILKLFGGAKPVDSLGILYSTGLDKTILNAPGFENLHPFSMDQRNPHHEFNVQDHTFKVLSAYNDMLKQQEAAGSITKQDRILGLIASWFHDYGKLHPEIGKPKDTNPDHYQYIGHEDKSAELADAFLRQIGVGSDDREFVTSIVREHMLPHNDVWNKRMMGKLREKTTIPGQNRKDIWKFVMWHAQADDAGKSSSVDPESQSQYDQRFQQTNDYMNAPPPIQPLVNGQRLMAIFPELHPKTGFIREVQRRLLDEQNAGLITDIQQAEQFVESIRNEILGKYMPNQPPPNQPQASNWYDLVKQADASSGTGPDGYPGASEGQTAAEKEKGVKHMIYYEPGESSIWQVGDRVRARQDSMIAYPREGKIVSKEGNVLKVRWGSGKTQSLNTDDIETMRGIDRI